MDFEIPGKGERERGGVGEGENFYFFLLPSKAYP